MAKNWFDEVLEGAGAVAEVLGSAAVVAAEVSIEADRLERARRLARLRYRPCTVVVVEESCLPPLPPLRQLTPLFPPRRRYSSPSELRRLERDIERAHRGVDRAIDCLEKKLGGERYCSTCGEELISSSCWYCDL